MLRTFAFPSILAISFCCQTLAQQAPIGLPTAPAITHHAGYRVVKQLDKTIDVEFVDTPLAEVVASLKSDHELPFVLDKAALDVAGIDPEEPVTFTAKNTRLADALNIICRNLDLALVPEDSLIAITTAEESEQRNSIANYPVWDLVVDPKAPKQADYDSLIELITMSVAQETWEEVGGMGSVVGHKGILSISQQYHVHQQIAKLIDGLRKLPTSVTAPQSALPVAIPIEGAWVEQNRKRLEALVDVEYVDTPLQEVVHDLNEKYEIPFQVDMLSLESAGIDPEETITASFNGVKLGTVLDRLLRGLELTYANSDGFVTIMTLEESENRLETRIYPVAGIVDNVGTERADYHSLIDLVTSIVAQDTWEEVGGMGSIVAYPSRACLVISQTNDVHNQLQSQLSDLHSKYRDPNAAPKISTVVPDDKIVTHVYMIPTRDKEPKPSPAKENSNRKVNAQFGGGGLGGGGGGFGFAADPSSELKHVSVDSLHMLIISEIASGTWSRTPDARISTLPDRLIVRHNHKVQKEVQELLDKLYVPVLNPYGDAPSVYRARNKGFGMPGGYSGSLNMGGGGMFNVREPARP